MAGLRPFKRDPDSAKQQANLVAHAEQLDRLPLLNGQLIEFEVPTGTTVHTFRHNLGRPYQAIFIGGVGTSASPFSEFVPVVPKDGAFFADISLYGVVSANLATTAPHTLIVWII